MLLFSELWVFMRLRWDLVGSGYEVGPFVCVKAYSCCGGCSGSSSWVVRVIGFADVSVAAM